MGELMLSGDIVVYLLGLAATWGAVMWRISALEKKVEKHNQLIDRTYAVEAREDVFDEQLKVVNHRLADLEAEVERRERSNEISRQSL